MEQLHLQAIGPLAGTIKLPGSKSISNRTLLLAALAEGSTLVRDLLDSDDIRRMLEALATLGVRIEQQGDSRDFLVHGTGGAFSVKDADLFLGNAGTAFRPLTAALALMQGHYHLHGVPRMHERPIGDLVDALRVAGADIDYLGNDGYPPLQIKPASLNAGQVIPVKGNVSSQFLTALLMALPLTGEDVTIEVVGELISKPYIEITLNLMARFGVQVQRDGWQRFTIARGQRYTSPGEIHVEGDASSASYFLAAGALAGGPVRVEGVGRSSIQGDVKFADALALMGAEITLGDNWIEARAPAGGAPDPAPARSEAVEPAAVAVTVQDERDGAVSVIVDGLRTTVRALALPGGGWLDACGVSEGFADLTDRPRDSAGAAGGGSVVSRMHGQLVKLAVAPGQRVARGEFLLAIEAMKMEHRFEAPVGGIVTEVGVAAGAQVAPGRLLVPIEPDAGPPA